MAIDAKDIRGKIDIPPGDDLVPVPAPVNEKPDPNRFCDLVLTGGVASGVVYPWAIVELARAYRFKNIGGTSVGAMAAALAAAAEYGRQTGFESSFEPLRRVPAALGEAMDDNGRTRMLSLFQPNERGRRLLEVWAGVFNGKRTAVGTGVAGSWAAAQDAAAAKAAQGSDAAVETVSSITLSRVVSEFLRVYKMPGGWGAAIGFVFAAVACWPPEWSPPGVIRVVLGLMLVIAAGLTGVVLAIWSDIRHGLIANDLGLCSGATLTKREAKQPGLTEWLHNGIQRSAGLKTTDRPLTFRDLWTAPAYPGGTRPQVDEASPTAKRTINLQMVTTSVTHGRPYRLPLLDETSRLYFKPEDMRRYFPDVVWKALEANAKPYVPRPGSHPEPGLQGAGVLELPGADLPIVVAARLSLSYPLLFSAVRLWAIDHEAPKGERAFKPCHFSDGGASSNFPIHLFDAALPRWPTFGMWLDRRKPYTYPESDEDGPVNDVWLPRFNRQGRKDGWIRFHPDARPHSKVQQVDGHRAQARLLLGFLGAVATSAVDWRDRTALRLPHVRNRVARLFLKPWEGGLHIGMPREQILRMAHVYGTETGKLFVKRFADVNGKQPSQAWREQRWVRMELFLEGLRERLTGLSDGAAYSAYTVPMQTAITEALEDGPVRDRRDGGRLSLAQAESLKCFLKRLETLETEIRDARFEATRRKPSPELRLRSPL